MKFALAPIGFGRTTAEPANAVPKAFRGEAGAKRMKCLAEVADVLAVIPAAGERLHAIMTGFYDLMHVLVLLLDRCGHCDHLRIATLSYNGRNLAELLRLLDTAAIHKVTLVTSCFFRDHNKELFAETRKEFASRGSVVVAARSHAKVACLRTPAGAFVVEGSANLRTNRNREQFCLFNDGDLLDWHAAWIDTLAQEPTHE